MSQTHLHQQASIKVLPEDESSRVGDPHIDGHKAARLPEGCLVVPMKVLDKPEPIPAARASRADKESGKPPAAS